MSLITVKNASKVFRHRKPRMVLRDHIKAMVNKPTQDGFFALKNVSFEVREKESVALVGANGAGKSTLLSLICGLARPDEGSVTVNGSIAPLLELSSGFHPDLTGHENMFLNAALLGMTEAHIRARYQSVLDFSEIGEFIHEPLRTYSAGMVLRLAFSIAVQCDPSIVVIDEVLGVGDSAFQKKCHDRINGLRAEGKTLLCVSHSAAMVSKFCDRAIWLHHGEIVRDGPTEETMEAYNEFMANPHSTPAPVSPRQSVSGQAADAASPA